MNILLAEPPIMSERIDASLTESVVAAQYADLDTTSDLWQTAVSCWHDQGTEFDLIDALEDGYVVLNPIPVEIKRVDDTTYLASFKEANIAMSGFDRQDAYQSLVAEILDTFDALVDERRPSPDAAAQLQVLRTYLGKA